MTFGYLKTLDVGDLQGASMEEINRAEAAVGIPFPEVYKDFLAVMGKNSGRLFSGFTYQVSQLEWMNTFYREMVKDMEHIDLSDKYLVIVENQGYAFDALLIPDDLEVIPKVYSFIEDQEGDCTFVDRKINFEEYVFDMVNRHFQFRLLRKGILSLGSIYDRTTSYIEMYYEWKSR